MNCCICQTVEFSVIVESHLMGKDLPNIICDHCLLRIFVGSDVEHSLRIGVYLFQKTNNGVLGKRCTSDNANSEIISDGIVHETLEGIEP